MTLRFRPSLSSFLALFLIVGLSVPLVSRAAYIGTVPDVWTSWSTAENDPPTLIKHLRSQLQETGMQRDRALLDVIALANCTGSCTIPLQSVKDQKIRIENETGKGTVIDLAALIPDLLDVYRSGPADGHRLLALSALIKIGNEQALDQLIAESPSQSEQVDRSTQRNVAAFYLEKYPELQDRTLGTGRLSLEDVRRARALQIKQAQKNNP